MIRKTLLSGCWVTKTTSCGPGGPWSLRHPEHSPLAGSVAKTESSPVKDGAFGLPEGPQSTRGPSCRGGGQGPIGFRSIGRTFHLLSRPFSAHNLLIPECREAPPGSFRTFPESVRVGGETLFTLPWPGLLSTVHWI